MLLLGHTQINMVLDMNKTAAYLKIQEKREARLPFKAQRIDGKNCSCAVYIGFNKEGKPRMTGFFGRSLKPASNYYYNSIEARNTDVQTFIKTGVERAQARAPKARALEVGDVLISVWGYDQTNIDYYLVLELYGKCGVVVVEIGYDKHEPTSCGGYNVTPDVNKIVGESFKKKADGERIRMNSYSSARKLDYTIEHGARVYKTSHVSTPR